MTYPWGVGRLGLNGRSCNGVVNTLKGTAKKVSLQEKE